MMFFMIPFPKRILLISKLVLKRVGSSVCPQVKEHSISFDVWNMWEMRILGIYKLSKSIFSFQHTKNKIYGAANLLETHSLKYADVWHHLRTIYEHQVNQTIAVC